MGEGNASAAVGGSGVGNRDNKINGKSTYQSSGIAVGPQIQNGADDPHVGGEGRVIAVAGGSSIGNRDNEINGKSTYLADWDHAQPKVWLVIPRREKETPAP